MLIKYVSLLQIFLLRILCNDIEDYTKEIDHFKNVYFNENNILHRFEAKICDSVYFLNSSTKLAFDSCIIPMKKSENFKKYKTLLLINASIINFQTKNCLYSFQASAQKAFYQEETLKILKDQKEVCDANFKYKI